MGVNLFSWTGLIVTLFSLVVSEEEDDSSSVSPSAGPSMAPSMAPSPGPTMLHGLCYLELRLNRSTFSCLPHR